MHNMHNMHNMYSMHILNNMHNLHTMTKYEYIYFVFGQDPNVTKILKSLLKSKFTNLYFDNVHDI